MSKSNSPSEREYRDPFTGQGFKLGMDTMPYSFHLHEVGCIKLSTDWNHPGVLSPFWRLYWSEDPGAWIECSGQRFDLNASRFLLLPSHALFDTHGSVRPVNHFWIHFSLHPDITSQDGLPIVVPCRKEFQIATLAHKVRDRTPQNGSDIYHLCAALLHRVFAQASLCQCQFPSKLRALLNGIETSLDEPPLVDELARRVGMSRGGFIRWFREHLKISPARYVLQRRINHACRLLKFSSASIDEIADSLTATTFPVPFKSKCV